jgi:hypothetical protein
VPSSYWCFDPGSAAGGYYERALLLAPESKDTLFNYAVSLYKDGHSDKAVGMLKRLLAIDAQHFDAQVRPACPAAHYHRGKWSTPSVNVSPQELACSTPVWWLPQSLPPVPSLPPLPS